MEFIHHGAGKAQGRVREDEKKEVILQPFIRCFKQLTRFLPGFLMPCNQYSTAMQRKDGKFE